ncbi:MAG TPA: lipid-binding SYLF domain-containing protein [Candidatus Xenobia bacterium]|nr:lipid-binding SYLF domain-containing protein [Candidatus Xenobia bacterium]
MRRSAAIVTLILALAPLAPAQDKEAGRLQAATQVLEEIMNVPENIPQDLLDKAECVGVIPSALKGAFIVGGSYGRGVFVCRSGEDFKGPWGPPAMYRLEGGSVGFQIGGQATDFVFLVMNPNGVKSLLRSKARLGADASVAAGPKGRTAEAATDLYLRAEILTYSRARGLFAGVSLEGSSLRQDKDANEALYGRPLSAKRILREGKVAVPDDAKELVSFLNRHSPKNLSE